MTDGRGTKTSGLRPGERAVRPTRPPTPKQLRRQALRRAAARRRVLAYGIPAVLFSGLLAIAVVVAGGSGGTPSPSGRVTVDGPLRTGPLQAGDVVPNYVAPGLSGGTIEWALHRGEAPILLSVWAPWCPHCQAEMPILGRVAKDYPGVHVMTVVTAVGQRPGPTPLEFFQEHGLSFETAVDDADGTIAAALGIQGFPTIFAVAPDGTVIGSASGELGEDGLRAVFDELAALAT